MFARRLRELDGEAREGLASALKTRPDRRSFAARLTCRPEQRAAIHDVLGETFSATSRSGSRPRRT